MKNHFVVVKRDQTPSQFTRTHATLTDAEREAKRLARTEKSAFVIYQAVALVISNADASRIPTIFAEDSDAENKIEPNLESAIERQTKSTPETNKRRDTDTQHR